VTAYVVVENSGQKEQVLTIEIEKFRVSFQNVDEEMSYRCLESENIYNL